MESVHWATCRGQLTKLINQATEYLENTDFSKLSEKQTLLENVGTLLHRLRNAHENLKKADVAARKIIKQEDMEKECESVLDYDDKAITIIAKLQSREKSLAGRLEHTMNTSTNGAGEQSSHGVKLKSLELKKFDGSFEKWLPFWEQFKPTVHDNPLLSSAAKFNFLSEALVDRASSTIQGFTPTEEP
ncbi:uncharacterized protein LOC118749113 [Rhagoletis pomonella]|uniref:uncharacterized protein LOC118749113 n=1 Tax=Rhagoletis pomonella TaxID=28610 RepID=UPI0017847119|nr:uncharacterized protein LOC118749113 [Rhagoletis pomonella]